MLTGVSEAGARLPVSAADGALSMLEASSPSWYAALARAAAAASG